MSNLTTEAVNDESQMGDSVIPIQRMETSEIATYEHHAYDKGSLVHLNNSVSDLAYPDNG